MKMKLEGFISFLCAIPLIWGTPVHQKNTCGYASCPQTKSDRINVHIIPHSHNDVGWVLTENQYFTGVGATISVDNIITSVVQALKRSPKRKFTQVETAFFWQWWRKQSEKSKNEYKNLVETGQIEIANGGFTMNDEACVHYQSTIDQFTRGLRILNDTLGPCGAPRVGWQIDPFGHSREQALIFRQLGFDGAFFARLDFNDRLKRIEEKRLDFLWKSSPNFNDSEIFYAILKNHYGSPTGFCFDITCRDQPVNDDPGSFDYNADQVRSLFIKVLEDFEPHLTTNNILIPMGGDFNYESAEEQYLNIDRLLKLFANDGKYNVFYSTPSCYLKSVNNASPKLSVKTDDILPYADNEHAYWSGYFTSRPTIKRFERTANKILQANKQLRSVFKILSSNTTADTDPHLDTLRDSVAVMQHHDAITGTESQAVTYNYVDMMNAGIRSAEESIGLIIGTLLSKSQEKFDQLAFASCLLSNISICENSSKDRFLVAVYNPLSKAVSHPVALPVQNASYSVIGDDGEEIAAVDVLDAISDFGYVDSNDGEVSPKELVFAAEDVPPMGLKLYYVTKKGGNNQTQPPEEFEEIAVDEDLVFGTKDLNFVLDAKTNRLKSATMNGLTLNITQDFYYYPAAVGVINFVASGAYLFRPESSTKNAKNITDDNPVLERQYRGNFVEEAHIRINDWVKQIIRVYKGSGNNFIEFDWLVGPIEVPDSYLTGKEIINRFTVSGLNNSGVFYTDSNGRETMRRRRNERVDYEYDPTVEPISSNYYPVTARIALRDEEKQLEVAVFNDRSQGGSSLHDGELELMVHRRLLVDDNRGVSEALDEYEFRQPLVVRGKHYLMFGSTKEKNNSFAAVQRDFQSRMHLSPYTLVADATADNLKYETLKSLLNFKTQFISKALPDNVNILTLERWRDEEDTFLLRLEHLLEKDEDDNLSKEVTVDLNSIFGDYKVEDINETTLGANVWMEDYLNRDNKFKWNTQGNETINSEMERSAKVKPDGKVTLLPMEIRTFIVKITKTK
ncbi:unnamed protein product [Phyllotreta striolata]|uniref:Alpha-mannosidase n=1 Tax=Phyllotreta striolata TaxID=444603 RepID=A0A9N9THP1_PHYSR|nr:unnamed protein product [Phyllotreta striolata]